MELTRTRLAFEQYSRWSELEIYVERIESFSGVDISFSIENSKALLESIGKEICNQKGFVLNKDASVHVVMKSAFTAIGYKNSDLITQIATSLANIGHRIGELRNKIGVASHGRTLDEIRERNSQVDELTRDFLFDSTDSVASLMIRAFENENPRASGSKGAPLEYTHYETFNESWDESYGEFKMGEYAYTASEILYNVDQKAYKTELKAFEESGDGVE